MTGLSEESEPLDRCPHPGRRSAARDLAPAVLVAVGIFVLSSLPLEAPEVVPDRGDLLAHAGVFGLLAFLLRRAWHRQGWRGSVIWPFAITVLYGALDELHQSFVRGRSTDPLDLVADTVGAALGIGLAVAWERMSRRSGS